MMVDRIVGKCDIRHMVKTASNLNAAPSGSILTRLTVLTDTVGSGIDFKKYTKSKRMSLWRKKNRKRLRAYDKKYWKTHIRKRNWDKMHPESWKERYVRWILIPEKIAQTTSKNVGRMKKKIISKIISYFTFKKCASIKEMEEKRNNQILKARVRKLKLWNDKIEGKVKSIKPPVLYIWTKRGWRKASKAETVKQYKLDASIICQMLEAVKSMGKKIG
jgi:hypothetical protein